MNWKLNIVSLVSSVFTHLLIGIYRSVLLGFVCSAVQVQRSLNLVHLSFIVKLCSLSQGPIESNMSPELTVCLGSIRVSSPAYLRDFLVLGPTPY